MILVGNKIITPSSNYLKINDQRVDLKQVFVVVVQRVVWKQPKESPGCLLNIYIYIWHYQRPTESILWFENK